MKKIITFACACLMALAPLHSNCFDEENCELTPVLPPPTNCSDYETQKVGLSMMGWGIAIIAAIAIIAGTYAPSPAAE